MDKVISISWFGSGAFLCYNLITLNVDMSLRFGGIFLASYLTFLIYQAWNKTDIS